MFVGGKGRGQDKSEGGREEGKEWLNFPLTTSTSLLFEINMVPPPPPPGAGAESTITAESGIWIADTKKSQVTSRSPHIGMVFSHKQGKARVLSVP